MLDNTDVTATIAVTDIHTARRFYEQVLGLTAGAADGEQVVRYRSGIASLLVYVSQFAGTNKATAATWVVDDVEAVVEMLRGKGVTFERYDIPDVTRNGDVHISGERKSAWFKDPDGNILALVNRS